MSIDNLELPASDPTCPFCDTPTLQGLLHETDDFFLLADHAPLVEGHTLIVPRTHFACYGALPAALDAEVAALKRTVRRFLAGAYREPVFFEHGVFRQTVYHAHLHAMPFGAVSLDLAALAREGGALVGTPDDVRRWYAERGHYFYLEIPSATADVPAQAALFPPELARYFNVLGSLRAATEHLSAWQPQPLRRLTSGQQVRALAEHWRTFNG